jgi:hypothetical protein
MHDYDDAATVESLMNIFGLPDWVDEPVYWQIWLSGADFFAFNQNREPGRLARSLTLFRSLITLHRRESEQSAARAAPLTSHRDRRATMK